MPAEDRLARSIAAIDEANAADPRRVAWDGEELPLEVLHARRMTRWLAAVDPDADAAQQLAARAHHLRRWERPRSDYPEGRAGYLRWRKDAREHHAAAVAELLTVDGWDAPTVADVCRIVRKEDLRTDRRVQAHEDALCLTFIELQAGEFLGGREPSEARRIVEKTAAKMSPRGRSIAVEQLPLPEWVAELLRAGDER